MDDLNRIFYKVTDNWPIEITQTDRVDYEIDEDSVRDLLKQQPTYEANQDLGYKITQIMTEDNVDKEISEWDKLNAKLSIQQTTDDEKQLAPEHDMVNGTSPSTPGSEDPATVTAPSVRNASENAGMSDNASENAGLSDNASENAGLSDNATGINGLSDNATGINGYSGIGSQNNSALDEIPTWNLLTLDVPLGGDAYFILTPIGLNLIWVTLIIVFLCLVWNNCCKPVSNNLTAIKKSMFASLEVDKTNHTPSINLKIIYLFMLFLLMGVILLPVFSHYVSYNISEQELYYILANSSLVAVVKDKTIIEKPTKDKRITDKRITDERIMGTTRHYPPGNKEWSNSIYVYNKNSVKSLPFRDKLANNLIKGYFNLVPLTSKNTRSRRMRNLFSRLYTKRIFVTRGEVKQTNDKAIVTAYTFNREKNLFMIKYIFLMNRLEKQSFQG